MKNYIEKLIDDKKINDTIAIVTEPLPQNDIDLCVILTNAGLRCRIGPHRLYTELSRKLAQNGITTIRYDSICTGDAIKNIDLKFVDDYFIEVENGLYVEGLIKIIKTVDKIYPNNKIILGGLCGGAVTSVYAYNMLNEQIKKKILGLFLLGIPFYHLQQSNTVIIASEVSDHVLKGYFKKLADFQSWKNLFAGRSDYKMMFDSISSSILKRLKKFKDEIPTNLNLKLVLELKKILEDNIKICFAYGEYDILLKEYEAGFEGYFEKKLSTEMKNLYQKVVIGGDSHNLFYEKSRDMLLQVFQKWITST